MRDLHAFTDARTEAGVATAGLSPRLPATWRLYLATLVAHRGGALPEDSPELQAIEARIRGLATDAGTPRA